MTGLEARLAEMDRTGIDVQVISPYPGHFVHHGARGLLVAPQSRPCAS